jgi:phosphoribosylformylglycinamidine cyclo-ligase
MKNENLYQLRGASSQKEEVHAAIKHVDKGLFPKSFCKILPDFQDDEFCQLLHADGTGSKSIVAYLYWKETGNAKVWRGISQDAIVMNTDDMMCSGVTNHILLSSTIGRNKRRIPGEILKELIEGFEEFLQHVRDLGIEIYSAGGETADLGDQIATVVVDATAYARLERKKVIQNRIQAGSVIVGFASDGRCAWETKFNSGIGSNGLTSARHDLLSPIYYEKYPETFDHASPEQVLYQGKFELTDLIEETGLDVGHLILSPTRTYLPLVKNILSEYFEKIDAMIHCTGGGQTKVLHFAENVHIIKDHLFEPPWIFTAIQRAMPTPWREMYQTFNMGHRLEIYTDEKTAEKIIQMAQEQQIQARIIGHVEPAESQKLTLISDAGTFVYGH